MKKKQKVFWFIVAIMIVFPSLSFCETYSQTIDFDADQGYISNQVWKHTLSQLPQNSVIQSASLTLRVQVWYWGWNIYEQNIDIMASDSTSFVLPLNRVCQLDPSTNRNPDQFYVVTCPLPTSVFEFIQNDGAIYIGTNTYNGTYYLDYSTLTVTTNYVERYTLTVNVDPIGSGSVTLNPLGGVYNSGQLVTLSAVNNTGYVFDFWTGDVSNPTQPTTAITMDTNQSVVAHFASDRDGDEVKDSVDGCPDDPNKTAPGRCGCGCVDTTLPWLFLLLD